MTRSTSWRFLAAALFSLGTSSHLDAQTDCVALLKHGLHNTYRTATGNSSVSSARSAFCSDYSSYRSTGQAAGLEVSYKLFSGTTSFSHQSAESMANAICRSDLTHTQADAMLSTFSSVIDAGAIAAYRTCVSNAGIGLMYRLTYSEVDAHTVTIEAWHQVRGEALKQKITGVQITQHSGLSGKQSVTCQGDLYSEVMEKGETDLDTNAKLMTCTRNGALRVDDAFDYDGRKVLAAPVTISVQTNLGGIAVELPELPAHAPPPPAVLPPIGSVMAFAGEAEPEGWMLCDGRELSRDAYPELFERLGRGSLHGFGNQTTTFHLPDYRGRFLRGVDLAAGVDPDKESRSAPKPGGATGNRVGSIQPDGIRKHSHPITHQGTPIGQNAPQQSGGFQPGNNYNPTGYVQLTVGETGGNETRPANASVNFIIRIR